MKLHFLCALAILLQTVVAAEVTVTPGERSVRVEIDGELFTEYVFADTPKPYLYPVIGPGGAAMTRNYPMKEGVPGETSDHPHHRSLWFAHGDVNGHDFWAENVATGRIVHERVYAASSGAEGVLQTMSRWVSAAGKDICDDQRTMRFSAVPGGRAIDFMITLIPIGEDLVLGDTKEGTMAIRTHPALRLKGEVATGHSVNSTGVRDRDMWGKRAGWVDYWGAIAGATVGVAIFDHPGNPRHPTWWHARDYGLIAANPFGVHDFERKPAGTGDLTVARGSSVTFRYRFVFHEGDAESAGIAKRYQQWSGGAR